MATKQEQIEFLESGVNELKIIHSSISSSYDAIKAKALALLAGEVAIVTFLFADSVSHKGSEPSQVVISIAIFYLIGIIMLSAAFLLFLYVVSPIQWVQPPESKVVDNMKEWFGGDKTKFLEYLKQEYYIAIQTCNGKLRNKARGFVFAIYLLTTGILILVLLKYGKGAITI